MNVMCIDTNGVETSVLSVHTTCFSPFFSSSSLSFFLSRSHSNPLFPPRSLSFWSLMYVPRLSQPSNENKILRDITQYPPMNRKTMCGNAQTPALNFIATFFSSFFFNPIPFNCIHTIYVYSVYSFEDFFLCAFIQQYQYFLH